MILILQITTLFLWILKEKVGKVIIFVCKMCKLIATLLINFCFSETRPFSQVCPIIVQFSFVIRFCVYLYELCINNDSNFQSETTGTRMSINWALFWHPAAKMPLR